MILFCEIELNFDPHAVTSFVAFISTFAGNISNGSTSGWLAKELYLGVAAVSNCVIGFIPKINSTVRNMLEVRRDDWVKSPQHRTPTLLPE